MDAWTDGWEAEQMGWECDGWRVEFEPQDGPRLAADWKAWLKQPSLPQALRQLTLTTCPSPQDSREVLRGPAGSHLPPRAVRVSFWTENSEGLVALCGGWGRERCYKSAPSGRWRRGSGSSIAITWRGVFSPCLLPSLSVSQDLSLSLATFQPSSSWGLHPSEAYLNQRCLNLCGSCLVYTLLSGLHSDLCPEFPLARLLKRTGIMLFPFKQNPTRDHPWGTYSLCPEVCQGRGWGPWGIVLPLQGK